MIKCSNRSCCFRDPSHHKYDICWHEKKLALPVVKVIETGIVFECPICGEKHTCTSLTEEIKYRRPIMPETPINKEIENA